MPDRPTLMWMTLLQYQYLEQMRESQDHEQRHQQNQYGDLQRAALSHLSPEHIHALRQQSPVNSPAKHCNDIAPTNNHIYLLCELEWLHSCTLWTLRWQNMFQRLCIYAWNDDCDIFTFGGELKSMGSNLRSAQKCGK